MAERWGRGTVTAFKGPAAAGFPTVWRCELETMGALDWRPSARGAFYNSSYYLVIC